MASKKRLEENFFYGRTITEQKSEVTESDGFSIN
jgi:hypothetical protein